MWAGTIYLATQGSNPLAGIEVFGTIVMLGCHQLSWVGSNPLAGIEVFGTSCRPRSTRLWKLCSNPLAGIEVFGTSGGSIVMLKLCTVVIPWRGLRSLELEGLGWA